MENHMKPPQRIYVELDQEEREALDRLRSKTMRSRPMELKFLLAQEVARRDAEKTEASA